MIKFIFTLLLTVLANTSPATAEFTPITDSNIADAVNLWQSDEASATTTYGHISDWDTSGVTDMGYLFVNAAKFNADISKWNTSMVIDFTQMFLGAKKFDGDLSDWVTSSATHMTSMFNTAEAFNGDISKWDTSSCTSMQGMFAGAKSFNRDISGWDTSKVTAMGFLFNDAIWFNADISKWNTQSVTNTRDTYKGACSLECEHYPTDHAGDCPVSPSAECENIGNRCATKTDEAECNDLYESCTWYNAECSKPAPTSAPTPGPRPLNPSPDFFISRAGFNKNVCAETNGDGIFKKKKCDVLSYGRQLFTLDTVTGLFYNQAADQCLDSHDVTAENPSPPYMDNCNKANYNQQWEIVPETNELRVRRENLGGGGDNGKRWCLDDVGAYYDGATWAMSPCRNLAPNTPEEDMNFHMYMLFRSYTAAPTLPPTMAPTMFPTTMSPTVAGPVTATEGEYISGWTFSPEENTSCDEVCAAVGSVCDETVFIEAMVEADLTTSTNGFETWFPEATRDVSVWQKFGAINKKVMGTNAVPGIRQTASDKNQGFVFGMTVDHGYRDQAGIESCKWEGGDFYPACYCGAAPTKAPTPPPPYVTASDIDGEYIPGWTFSANDYVSCSNVCTAVDSVCHEETFHNAIVAANLSTDGVGGDTWFPESLNVTVWTGFNRSFTNIVNGNVGPPCIRQDNLGSLYGYRPNLIVPQIQSCYWKKLAYYPACYCGKATVAPTESPTMVPTTAAPTPEPYILPSIPSGSKYIWGKKFMYCASICSSAGMECRESDVQPEFEFDSQKKLETLIANGDFAAYDGSPAEDGIPTDAFTKNWKTGGESTDTTCPYYNTINASYNWCSAGQTKVKDRCYAQSQNQLYLCLCHEKTESPTMVPTSAAPTSAAPTPEPYILPSIPSESKYIWGKKIYVLCEYMFECRYGVPGIGCPTRV